MATYNWSYSPNGQYRNSDIITIANTPDDVRPNGIAYVALFGNDEIGNGSRMYPFKTIVKGLRTEGTVIVGSGVYREGGYSDNFLRYQVIGDGDVVIDVSYFDFFNSGHTPRFYDVEMKGNYISLISGRGGVDDNLMRGVKTNIAFATNTFGPATYTNCIFSNLKSLNLRDAWLFQSCTFVNIENIQAYSGDRSSRARECIFVNCNIAIANSATSFLYCLFSNCNFKLGNGDGGAFYPSTPNGYTLVNDFENFKLLYRDYFGISIDTLSTCFLADPKFNNKSIEDYSLAFDSPAKNMSYFGTYIGALSIGYPIRAKQDEAEGDFDFSSNVNLIISDDSILLSDPSIDASIESNVKPNLVARELAKAPIYGFYADRNGQYLDSIDDLSSTVVVSSLNLKPKTPYIVENASILINGNVILPGVRFTTTDVVSFSTDNGGVCREIIEAPQRHTIMARFSDGKTTIAAGSHLTVGFWYYADGSVTYEGNIYSDSVFKATANSPFSGSGVVVLAMGDEEYQHYEPGIKFMSNNIGDQRTGDIVRGNGDPNYQRGQGKEFPINARFIQIKYMIKVNNLKP